MNFLVFPKISESTISFLLYSHNLLITLNLSIRVEYKEDTQIGNAGTFTILLEDHTAGNMIKMDLLSNPNVLFSGYRMPHPLENKLELKIQTNGKIKPITAFAESLDSLTREIDTLGAEFEVYFYE